MPQPAIRRPFGLQPGRARAWLGTLVSTRPPRSVGLAVSGFHERVPDVAPHHRTGPSRDGLRPGHRDDPLAHDGRSQVGARPWTNSLVQAVPPPQTRPARAIREFAKPGSGLGWDGRRGAVRSRAGAPSSVAMQPRPCVRMRVRARPSPVPEARWRAENGQTASALRAGLTPPDVLPIWC